MDVAFSVGVVREALCEGPRSSEQIARARIALEVIVEAYEALGVMVQAAMERQSALDQQRPRLGTVERLM